MWRASMALAEAIVKKKKYLDVFAQILDTYIWLHEPFSCNQLHK